jgi:hypothetical protein
VAPRETRGVLPDWLDAGRYTRLEIRFRAQFCYISAYTEPEPPGPNWPPPDWPETAEERLERLRNTPTHLCRLRYFGNEEGWGYAFFAYSSERYELSVFPSGEFLGPPEDAFAAAAGAYLRNFGSFYVREERASWVFKFNPSQRLRKAFGWSSTYRGDL